MTSQKERNLDNLLDLVVRTQDDIDRNEFYLVLLKSELFSPKIKNKEGKSGLAISEVNEKKLLIFYTTCKNKELIKPFMGIEGEHVLQTMLDSNDLDGISIRSESDSLLIMLRAEISRILKYTKRYPSATEIDRLIADFTDNHHHRKEDRSRFNTLFYHGNFYTSIENEESEPLKFPLLNAGGHNMVLFYTHSDNSKLGFPYAGMSGKEIMEMVLKAPDIDGIALMSNIDESWFGFTKQDIPELMQKYQSI